jgi:hypothetical protein
MAEKVCDLDPELESQTMDDQRYNAMWEVRRNLLELLWLMSVMEEPEIWMRDACRVLCCVLEMSLLEEGRRKELEGKLGRRREFILEFSDCVLREKNNGHNLVIEPIVRATREGFVGVLFRVRVNRRF